MSSSKPISPEPTDGDSAMDDTPLQGRHCPRQDTFLLLFTLNDSSNSTSRPSTFSHSACPVIVSSSQSTNSDSTIGDAPKPLSKINAALAKYMALKAMPLPGSPKQDNNPPPKIPHKRGAGVSISGSSKRSRQPKSEEIYSHCHKKGHIKTDCPYPSS
ncbi:hypothetical protein ACHAPO_002833 [Fusarium lateritium]